MNSCEKLMKWVNNEQSMIRIRTNESFSIPFISEIRNKMYLTLFSYSRSFRFGRNGGSAHVSNVFYINPNNFNDYSIEPVEAIDTEYSGFPLFDAGYTGDDNRIADSFNELVLLTDKIVGDPEHAGEHVKKYADLFSKSVGDDLKPYYLELGRQYFSWLNSIYTAV